MRSETKPQDEAATSAQSDQDDAIAMVGEQPNAIDPVVEARVVRKIDWFLIPAMIVGCELSPVSSSPTSLISH